MTWMAGINSQDIREAKMRLSKNSRETQHAVQLCLGLCDPLFESNLHRFAGQCNSDLHAHRFVILLASLLHTAHARNSQTADGLVFTADPYQAVQHELTSIGSATQFTLTQLLSIQKSSPVLHRFIRHSANQARSDRDRILFKSAFMTRLFELQANALAAQPSGPSQGDIT